MIDILRSSKEYQAHSFKHTFVVSIASHKFISQAMFRCTLPLLKMYSSRYIVSRFLILAVYIGIYN